MPTDLPRPKRKQSPRIPATAVPKHPVVRGLLNACMIGSVLLLFALVLLQQKRWVDGETGTVADAFIQKVQAAFGAQGNIGSASNLASN